MMSRSHEKRRRGWAFHGEINANTALRLGIVSCVVPAAKLGGASGRLIAALADRSH